MKIAITGATGFLGCALLETDFETANDFVLIGRDTSQLLNQYPEHLAYTYDDLPTALAGCDLLIHLAVMNNDATADEAAFHKVNVTLWEDVISAARAAGVPRVVNVSSFHASFAARTDTPYAHSKRAAAQIGRDSKEIEIVNLFLPAVYGKRYAGRMSILNHIPFAFPVVSALAPVVNISRVAQYLTNHALTAPTGEDVFLYDPKSENRVYRWVKRLIDLSFALVVLVMFGWGLLLVWGVIKLTSKGPGIFAQDRVGRGGRVFTCYKFRTMQQNTLQAGTHEISAASVTRIGAILRKTKIDELPQVWNILKNDVSLVGPRPCLPVQTDVILARQRVGVFNVVPGITGLAQINNIDMSTPEKLAQWDAYSIAQQSIFSDLRIILATFTGAGQGDKIAHFPPTSN
jgi:lipopolysaccharide/colanic/teichoic acid biosynthesis glycosyltransferase